MSTLMTQQLSESLAKLTYAYACTNMCSKTRSDVTRLKYVALSSLCGNDYALMELYEISAVFRSHVDDIYLKSDTKTIRILLYIGMYLRNELRFSDAVEVLMKAIRLYDSITSATKDDEIVYERINGVLYDIYVDTRNKQRDLFKALKYAISSGYRTSIRLCIEYIKKDQPSLLFDPCFNSYIIEMGGWRKILGCNVPDWLIHLMLACK